MIISHDLRNPLQSLKMLLDMAARQNFSENDFKKYLPILSKDVSYTSGLLNNLLHWTQSQMKGESVNPVNFDLKYVIRDIVDLYTKQAEHKKVELSSDVKESLEVFADINMTELVLRNLVSNAIKFCNENDRITISAKTKDGAYIS